MSPLAYARVCSLRSHLLTPLLAIALAAAIGGHRCLAEEQKATFKAVEVGFMHLDISPDGSEIFADAPGGVVTLDAATGKAKSLLRLPTKTWCLSRSGDCVIDDNGAADGTGVVYSRSTGKRLRSAPACFPREKDERLARLLSSATGLPESECEFIPLYLQSWLSGPFHK
jgi:hypothetical protein